MPSKTRRTALAVLAMLAAACSEGAATTATTTPSAPAPSATTTDAVPPTPAATTTSAASSTTAATAASSSTVATTTSGAPRRYDFSAVGPIVERLVAEHQLNGAGLVVVDRHDGQIYEQYWGEFGPQRITLIASASKMLTAGVVLHLQDRGLLDINRPVADYVPWGAGNPTVTIAELLSNSSGLVGLLPEPAYAPYRCQYVAAGSMQECAEQIFTTPADDADVIAPNTEFRYGGGQWQVAGAVAEAVSGKPWATLIEEIYDRPCAVPSLGYNNHFSQYPGADAWGYPQQFSADPTTLRATENPNMEGGAYIRPGDYAKLLLMLLRDGTCDRGGVLSAEAIEQMFTDRTTRYGGYTGFDGGYALGWFIDQATQVARDPGAYGAVPWIDRQQGYAAYLVIERSLQEGLAIMEAIADPVETAIQLARHP